MLIQIYEVSTAFEASALADMGVDHIGILVGDRTFPREQSLSSAVEIRSAIKPPTKLSALFLSTKLDRIAAMARVLEPDIIHLGAAPELLTPADCRKLKGVIPAAALMRS